MSAGSGHRPQYVKESGCNVLWRPEVERFTAVEFLSAVESLDDSRRDRDPNSEPVEDKELMKPQVPGEFLYRADPAAHGVPDLLPIACMSVGPLQRRSRTSPRAAFLLALVLTPAGFGLAGVASATGSVAQDEQRSLAARFDAEIAPFLKTNCLGCHGLDTQEGDISLLNLEGDPAVESSVAVWW